MTATVYPGRFTAHIESDFVVFLIGMRINKFFAFRKWLPVARAMPRMIKTLYRHPEKGFLSAENFINGRTVLMVQYWRSFEDLERFARDPADPHLEAWKQFHKAIGDDGSVGIWHETYVIRPGCHEAVYVNMPRFGLAQASGHIPVSGTTQTARQRISTAKHSPTRLSPLQEA